ncbi:MAG: hypothetical protein K8H88_03030 [Sandaracinaceae bacterium]|nr:hypothetical protein [Sandaracinaceae bacterium]
MKRALVLALLLVAPATTFADPDDWTDVPSYQPTPGHFALELRVGQYFPGTSGWSGAFGGDAGPMLAFELDYFPWRIPYIGLIGVGAGLGWSQWEGAGMTTSGTQAEQTVVFEMIPITTGLVLRVDVLARELRIPLVLTGKAGFDFAYWVTGTGGVADSGGWAIGPRFAGQAALELDFLEPRAARRLDEEWGINHTEVFFEAYGSFAGALIGPQLDLTGWGWSIGLGFTF